MAMDEYGTADLSRQLDLAYEAVDGGRTEQGVALLQRLALASVDPADPEAKDVQRTAQFTLGELYWNGRGVPRDDRLAIHWYELAGENGHPFAQFWLGNAFCTGQRAEQDHRKAMYWYEKAALQNVAWAQYHFALYLTVGEHADLEEAFRWMRKAADSNVINAQIYLVRAYRQGLGTPPDPWGDTARSVGGHRRPVGTTRRRSWGRCLLPCSPRRARPPLPRRTAKRP